MTPSKIDSFWGDYRFLSNFYKTEIVYEGLTYGSTEAAYQSAKTTNETIRKYFSTLSPADSKKYGQKIKIREDWDDVKIGVMLELTRAKYLDRVLRKRLLATGDAELIEGNTWNDTFWGVCKGEGLNHLGQILMVVREELRNG